MKSFIAFFALLAVASSFTPRSKSNYQTATTNNYAPVTPKTNNYEQQQQQPQVQKQIPIVPIIKYEAEHGTDAYHYGYEAGNGIAAAEQGYLKNAGQKNAAMVVEGYYSFPGADGKVYTVKYIADENGYRAFGDHLPTPPPIPAEIQEGLAKIAAQPQQQQQQPQAQQQVYNQQQQQPQQQNYNQQAQYYDNGADKSGNADDSGDYFVEVPQDLIPQDYYQQNRRW